MTLVPGSAPRPRSVTLRPATAHDVPALFAMQSDPHSNALAGTKPRTRDAFEALWAEILNNSAAHGPVVARVMIADEQPVGSINVFTRAGIQLLGYWIDRPHWGRGIASRAIALMITEVTARPLYATVAAHNEASLRALTRNGFIIESRTIEPEDDRYVGGEVVTLRLLI